jgi:hypothetical protein
MTGPILQTSDIDKLFIIDCDASSVGFGIVLHQGVVLVVFLKLAACKWELIGLVQVVRHSFPYLWSR